LSLVFRDKISSPWIKRIPSNEGAKKRYFTAIGSSNVKMVADRHGVELFRNVNIDDLE